MKIRAAKAVIAAFTACALASCAGLYCALNSIFDGDVPVDLINDVFIDKKLNAQELLRLLKLASAEEDKKFIDATEPYFVALMGDREIKLEDVDTPEKFQKALETTLLLAVNFYALEETLKAYPLPVDDADNPLGTHSSIAKVLLENSERELRDRYITLSGTPEFQPIASILDVTGPADPNEVLTRAITLKKVLLRMQNDGSISAAEFLEFVDIRNSSRPTPSPEAEAAAKVLLNRVDLPSTRQNIEAVAVQTELSAQVVTNVRSSDLLPEPTEVTPKGPR